MQFFKNKSKSPLKNNELSVNSIRLPKLKYLALSSFLVVLILLIFWVIQNNSRKITLGFIADIHAGDQKYRDDGEEYNNNIIPMNFEKNVKNSLENMKNDDLIFTLGDNLNRPSKKNTKKLLEITKDYPIYWAKGNHDKPSDFNEFFSSKDYYLVDKSHWRIIILDNSLVFPDTTNKGEHGKGYVDDEQIAWLKKSLETKKDVVVIMHIPIFDRYALEKVRPEEKYLEDIFIASGKVKHVFSGHFHVHNKQIEKNGITYHIIPSISLEGSEGKYYEITLD